MGGKWLRRNRSSLNVNIRTILDKEMVARRPQGDPTGETQMSTQSNRGKVVIY